MTQETHSYETSVTEGQSTSIANTVTWNEWEEVSEAVETPLNGQMTSGYNVELLRVRNGVSPTFDVSDALFGTVKIAGGVGLIAAGCTIGAATIAGCVGGIAGGALAITDGLQDWESALTPDEVQNQTNINNINSNTNINNVSSSAEANASIVLNQNFDFQGVVNSLDGVQYAIDQQGALIARGLQDVSYAISQPRFTETAPNGKSWGGAQTTTNEVYEEHTITEGQAFTSGQTWETAWAVDSSHAADLTFDFTVANLGTEYARELTGVIFNVYLGDDETPLVSYPAWEQFAMARSLTSSRRTATPLPQTLCPSPWSR